MGKHNLLHALYDHRQADSVALQLADGSSWRTADLLHASACYAGALAELGVRHGDRVSFKLEKAPEIFALAHGCLRLGAILHPLNMAYTDEEVGVLLADARPLVFVCEPSESARFANLTGDVGATLQTLSAHGAGTLGERAATIPPWSDIARVDADDTAALLYTSGTTGKPKGAQITHRNLAMSAQALAEVWALGSSDVLLHALPLYHAHGLLTAPNTLFVAGGSLLLLPRFDAPEVVRALDKATVIMGVPTHYARLLNEPGFDAAFAVKRPLAISGSAPLPLELAQAFERRTGRRLIERYGSTEAAIVTAVPAGTEDCTGWVGWPLPGVEVRLSAETSGDAVAPVSVGGLETRGHNVFAGYWQRPDVDREAFTPDGWFITGDIAETDASGRVRLLGRSKDLVISGGLNVYPREVETVLDTIDDVRESAVFGVSHPDFGEAVVAAVESSNATAFDEVKIIAVARKRLAAYKVPKRVVRVEEIPRNAMGKVLKAELRQRYGQLFTKNTEETTY